MNTEQKRALLPCPFCGGKPRISKQLGESLWSHDIVLWTGVQCDECGAQVEPTCEGYEVEAVDIWNSRAALESQDLKDAERYRTLVATGHFVPAPRPYFSVWGLRTTEGKATKAELDEAIDHARRVKGNNDATI
jgi:Lar family restriction alleviation protein